MATISLPYYYITALALTSNSPPALIQQVSLLGCLWQTLDFLFMAAASSSASPGRALCSTLLLAPYITCLFGTAYMSAVSGVRYATVKRAADEPTAATDDAEAFFSETRWSCAS